MSASSNEMTIWDHLDELRKRLVIVILSLVAAAGLSFYFAPHLLDLLAAPVGGLENLHVIRITENISVAMKISLLGGACLAMPVIVYELLAFILPGLHQNEQRWIYFGVPAASLLFVGGVLFAFLVMMPVATPTTDPVNMAILMVPLFFLYWLSVLLAALA